MSTGGALFEIRHRHPETGALSTASHQNLSALRAVQLLEVGSFESSALAKFAVVDQRSGYVRSAEQFLEDNPEIAVVAAWQAGGAAARRARQTNVEQYWPNLAMALNALAVAHDA